MVFKFYGISQSDVGAMMPTLIKVLGLGHPFYSAVSLPPVQVFDQDGKRIDQEGKVVCVPGFDKIREDTLVLVELSSALGVPVTMTIAPVKAGIDGKVY